jgi:radical SAM protein with 4Fe4S-binding SPASM domain
MEYNNDIRIDEYVKTGANIGHHVFMDNQIWLDKSFPELIKIEDFVVIASGVKILTHDSSICNTKGFFFQKGMVCIKRNSFIGANAIILPAITIGENSIIGAGSVITKNVPPNMVVAGNPAKLICSTDELLQKRMMKTKYMNCKWRSPYLAPEFLDIANTKLSPDQFKLFKHFINRDLYVTEYPKYLVIESTNCCNLNCIMCPRNDMTRPQGYMDFDLFKKIIDEVEGKVEFIYLHFFGEPFLHSKIIDFINYAAGKGMTIALSTNATLLNEKLCKDILKSKLDLLIISIDSLNPETYDKIRKGGSQEKILNNINTLLKLRQSVKSPLNVSLQMIEMSLNKHEIELFTSRWDLNDGLNLTIKPLCNYANQVKNINNLGNFQENSYKSRKVCVEPWRGLVIGWDGTVVPCCNDFDYKCELGDVKKNSLQEIWNSEKMQELRKCQSNGTQKSNELCKGCNIHTEDYLSGISHISSFNPTRKESYAYFDKGLYTLEIQPEYENLWTKKDFEISIQDKFQDVKIILCNDNPIMETVHVEISLFGNIIKNEIIGRTTEIVLRTPLEFKGRLLRYHFSLENDWVPRDLQVNFDTRRLGIRIEKIYN